MRSVFLGAGRRAARGAVPPDPPGQPRIGADEVGGKLHRAGSRAGRGGPARRARRREGARRRSFLRRPDRAGAGDRSPRTRREPRASLDERPVEPQAEGGCRGRREASRERSSGDLLSGLPRVDLHREVLRDPGRGRSFSLAHSRQSPSPDARGTGGPGRGDRRLRRGRSRRGDPLPDAGAFRRRGRSRPSGPRPRNRRANSRIEPRSSRAGSPRPDPRDPRRGHRRAPGLFRWQLDNSCTFLYLGVTERLKELPLAAMLSELLSAKETGR